MENINSMKEDIKILKGDSLPRRNIRVSIPAAAGSEEQLQIQKMSDTDSSEDHNTLKSAYKGLNDNRQPPSTYVKTQYGYSQESLPYVETIAPKLRQAIVEGKDINLAMLLMPPAHYFEAKDTYKKDKPDPRLYRMLSIEEFISAFGTYKNIMCEQFPHRRAELDLYERDVVDMSTRYGGSAFYEYHKQLALDRRHILKTTTSL